jgi:hypothetical protein
MVCASCNMFGPTHKQHPVITLPEAIKQLRGALYTQLERGKLKVEHTEMVLLDIRQAILTCDQMKNKLVNSINDSFARLTKAMKERKAEVLGEIDKYFEEERNKILTHETDWKEKQKLTQELLRLSAAESTDTELLQRSRFIVDSIARINEAVKFKEMKLINSLNDHLLLPAADVKYVDVPKPSEPSKDHPAHDDDDEPRPKDVDITLHQFLVILKSYMTISEHKCIQYKA